MPEFTVQQLRALPMSERYDALESMVLKEFRTTLLMADDEALPTSANYFELGLTSLRVTEIKQRLERRLECEINTSLLFNSPTVARLLEHLTEEVLPELFGGGTRDTRGPSDPPSRKAIVDQVLNKLYQG